VYTLCTVKRCELEKWLTDVAGASRASADATTCAKTVNEEAVPRHIEINEELARALISPQT